MLDAALAHTPRRYTAMLEACARSRGAVTCIVAWLLIASFARTQYTVGEVANHRRDRHAAPGRLPLFYDGSLRGVAGPDDAPAVVLRELIESDYTWETSKQSIAQCTIDVENAAAFITRVGVNAQRAADSCPDPAEEKTCAVFTTAMVASISWIGAFVSLIAQSCQRAVDANFIDDRLLCSADISMILSNLLDIAKIAQLVATDCAPEGSVNASAPAHWLQHKSGPITGKDFWKKHPVPALADGKKPSAAFRGVLAGKFQPTVGRRLDGTIASLFANSSEAHKKFVELQASRQWRKESIALCTVDVLQNINCIGYSIFQIRSVTLTCPDARACPVDILNMLAFLSWIVLFASNSFVDCPLKPFAGAACSRDVAALTGATANLAASIMSLSTDCIQK